MIVGVDLAVDDIEPEDQIICDYGTLNVNGVLRCHCGMPDCRGDVAMDAGPQDLAEWDRKVAAAGRRLLAVPQPLWPLVVEKERLRDIAAGRVPPPGQASFRSEG